MKIKYDFHIHSALSPCADNDMTPVNIVAYASLSGLNMIALSDHNAIGNVEVALKAGKAFGVTVVPAIEVQTSEDIHILCLFRNFKDLSDFHSSLKIPEIKNKPEIFGDQLILDEDDVIIERYDNLLLVSAEISSGELPGLTDKFNGLAIPAHIDREANGMLQILGAIEKGYNAVELSTKASETEIAEYSKKYKLLIDSDAHTLSDISEKSEIDLKENSIEALFEYLKG